MTNRVQFNSLDVIPAFGAPLYLTTIEIPLGYTHHCNQLIYHRETNKTIQSDIATEYRAWHNLIHTQLAQFCGIIGLRNDIGEYTLKASYVRKVEAGEKVDITGTYSSAFTGVCFFNQVDCDMIWTSPYDSWRTATSKFAFLDDNLLNSNSWSFKPNVGQLSIYPSSMSLQVTENKTNESIYLLEFYLE